MSVTFPNTASLLYRQEISPWYNGFNAPGSGSNGQLTFTNMDYNWYYLNSASYQTITVIKGAAYTGSANTFTEPQTFTSNVGISGSLSGSSARFSGQVISSYPGIGFLGTASWAANAITSSVLVITSSISSSYASASTSASLIYITASQTNADYTLVFKNSTGALPNFYQLAADNLNGPYYNPSTNIFHGAGLTVSASNGVFTSITGSISGSISSAVSSSYALSSSYAAVSQQANTFLGSILASGSVSTTPVPGLQIIAGATKTNGSGVATILLNELTTKTLKTNAFITTAPIGTGVLAVSVVSQVGATVTFQGDLNTDFSFMVVYF